MTVNFEKATEEVELGSAFGVGYTVPRVNLLPPEIAQERQLRRTQAILGLVVVGVLGAVGAGYLLASAGADSAADGLATEQKRTVTLNAEASKYAEVPRTLAQVESAQNARSTAMASDVLWSPYLDDLALTYPKDVWITDLTATVGAPAGAAAASGLPADPLTRSGIGTITVLGTGKVHSDVSAWLDVLAGTEGFADPSLSQSERNQIDGTVIVDFTTQAVVTSDALSNRYEREAG